MLCCCFEDWGKSHAARNASGFGRPVKKLDCTLQSPGASELSDSHLAFLTSRTITNVCCFKPLNLWQICYSSTGKLIQILSILLGAYWTFVVYILWRNVNSNPLSILQLGYLSFYCEVEIILYSRVLSNIWFTYIFSRSEFFFLLSWWYNWQHKVFNFDED